MLPRPSYRNISPVESGGERARQGFTFQDHVAAGYCIDMLLNADILEVWCELLDDITIVRNQAGQEEFEFVQVKSNKLDQLWSVAELCKRERKNPGTSILEKSFANERGAEPCRFRIVTCRDVNKDIKLLTLPLNSPVRTAPNKKFTHLCQQVFEKLPSYKSPIGSDTSSWLSRTEWDVRYSEEAIREKNLSNLRAFGKCIDVFLSDDQWHEIYEKILSKVKEAGEANWEINLDAKKFKRNKFFDWVIPLIKLADVPENLPHSGIRQFVSREKELETLHRQLQEDGAMSAIIGMRGVGKTELARQYALKYKRSYPGGICWLHTKEDVRLKIVQFAKSRLHLDVPDQQDLSTQVSFCWTYWNRPGRVLVVLDDVNNFTEIEPLLPPQNERFRVLITTHWKFDDFLFSVTLYKLTEVAALELLAQWVKTEQIFCNVTTKEDVPSELCARLGHLPLALHLVGRYIKKRQVTLMEMLQRLEGKGLRHPALQVDQNDRSQTIRIERGVVAAFELSWEELSESARQLGYSLSLCASTHTAWSLIKSVTNESEIEELEDARVELESLHLLQVQDKDSYQLHSLIREFFQDKLGSTDELLKSIKQKVDQVIALDKKLQNFLNGVNQKFISASKGPNSTERIYKFHSYKVLYKSAAIRAFYFALAFDLVNPSAFTRKLNFVDMSSLADALNVDFEPLVNFELIYNLNLTSILELAITLDPDIKYAFSPAHNLALIRILDPELNPDEAIQAAIELDFVFILINTLNLYNQNQNLVRVLDLTLVLDLALARILNFALDLTKNFSLVLKITNLTVKNTSLENWELALVPNLNFALTLVSNVELQHKLAWLQDQLPDRYSVEPEQFMKWWRTNGRTWTQQLRTVLNHYRSIGYDWRFSEEQKAQLEQYYDANKLLVNCLNDDCKVNSEVREAIEETLLLPVAEIERRKRERILR